MTKLYSTPWGAPQEQKQIAHGIHWVSTAGHGGFFVSEERRAEMPTDCRETETYAGKNWYEEDCDWAIVCLAFPDLFKPQDYFFAVSSCASYHKHLRTPERVARAEAWLAENADKWASGGGMTMDKDGVHGWVESAYKLTDQSQRKNKWFPSIPILPAVFTLEEFENAKTIEQVRQAELFAAA